MIARQLSTKSPALQRALEKKAMYDNIILPEEAQEPYTEMGDYAFLFAGERGIGKTTLASQFPNAFHMMFEPGGKSLAIRCKNIIEWKIALKIRDLILKTPGYCDVVVIDTGYMSYEQCYAYKLNEFGITDPKDLGFGNAWKFIEKEYRDFFYSFLLNNIGIIVITHTEEKEIKKSENKNGKREWVTAGTKIKSEIGSQANRLFKAIIDVEGYYFQDWNNNGKRFLRIKESEDVQAKNRIEGHFLYTNNSQMELIYMGESKEEGYNNLKKAFNNEFTKQEEVSNVPKTQVKVTRVPLRRS